MLQTAAMLFWLTTLWVLATGRWAAPADWATAFAAACVCTLIAVRLGGVSTAFAALPRGALSLARSAIGLNGLGALMAAVLNPRQKLRPALVQVAMPEEDHDALVDADGKGALVHVLIEDLGGGQA